MKNSKSPTPKTPKTSQTSKTPQTDVWLFYLDPRSKWRWKRTAPNGEIVGASTQGYAFKVDCEKNAERNGWKKK